MSQVNERLPLVSVVVATYNRGGVLLEALDGILNQDYRRYEVFVVDDGSTDDTAARLAEFGGKYPERLKTIRVANCGPGLARNEGVRAARGELVAFTDDDVVVPREWISRLVEILQSCGCDAVSGGFAPYSMKTPAERYLYYRQCIIHGERAKQVAAAPMMNFIVPRDLFLETGGFIRGLTEDWAFCRELGSRGKRIWYDPSIKVAHRYQPEWGPAVRRIKEPAILGVQHRADRGQRVLPYVVYSTLRGLAAPAWCLWRYPLDLYAKAVWIEWVFVWERVKAYGRELTGRRKWVPHR